MKKYISKLIIIAIAILVGVGVFFLDQGKAFDLNVALCDAFSVPGLLVIMIALLLWISGFGSFDGLGYIGQTLLRFLPGGGLKPIGTYREYVEEKREKRRKRGKISLWFVFLLGGALIGIGMLLYFVIPSTPLS